MIKQPDMMSTVAGFVEIRFQYTCCQMDEFLIKHCPDGSKTKITKESACKSLLSVGRDGRPDRGDREAIKPALLNARALARELQCIENKYRWKIMSEVWAELLGYAAVHCGSYAHAQQLCKGRELITLVWLLMAQLDVHPHFRMPCLIAVVRIAPPVTKLLLQK
ncbi:hypothetical protein EUGRSUZ_J01282 [Eucalyptus grandis]|uniref:Uncharacterized protein n=2 Tax=Eucalyptus grandis TaxID=71139 RepID=A0ACC3J4K0_EUCGR|nr:hypothetical protein EUGRSUZ_J01282 [Eucalyptus grandis]